MGSLESLPFTLLPLAWLVLERDGTRGFEWDTSGIFRLTQVVSVRCVWGEGEDRGHQGKTIPYSL